MSYSASAVSVFIKLRCAMGLYSQSIRNIVGKMINYKIGYENYGSSKGKKKKYVYYT